MPITQEDINDTMQPLGSEREELTIDHGDILKAKRAVVVLMECSKVAYAGKEAPEELRIDVQALMRVIRTVEKL